MPGSGYRLLQLTMLVAGCRSSEVPGQPTTLATWRLSSLPAVDIGVDEGDQPHELSGASSSLRLPDGRVVVANSGSYELRFFDGEGRFLHTSGRKGSGPGEFDGTMHLIPVSPDRFAVFVDPRLSMFDTSGNFLSATRIVSPDRESFPLPVWLYRRNWIEGPADSLNRPAIAGIVDRMPSIPPGAYRFVHVADDGRVWTQERTSVPADSTTPWKVYAATGRALASITIPAEVEIHQIGPDFILARHWAENQVEHIQLFQVEGITSPDTNYKIRTTPPAGSSGERGSEDSVPSTIVDDVAAGLRNLVMAQETYYSNNARYAERASDLAWQAPEGMTVHLMTADKRGWVGVLAHQRFPVICGMAVGGSTPPGWPEGSPKCSILQLPHPR